MACPGRCARCYLVSRDAAVGIMAHAWTNAREPRARRDRVCRPVGVLVLEARYDRELVLEWLERLEDLRQIEFGAFLGRRPLVHDRAVREIDEAHPRERLRGGLRERRTRRDHRIEQRQRDRRAHAAQHGSAG